MKPKKTMPKNEKKTEGKSLLSTIEQYLQNKWFLFLFIPLTLILLIVYRDYISMRQFFIFRDIGSDTITFNYPQYVCLSEYVRNIGVPGWSFQQGLGQNLYPLSLGDLFGNLLVFSGKGNIPKMLIWIELLKIALIALVSYLYFRRIGLSKTVSIIGSFVVSFSGFVILGGTWYIFSTQALYFMFMLYSLECLMSDKYWFLFPVSVFVTASYQPVDLLISGIFLALYFVFRTASDENFSIGKTTIVAGKLIGLAMLGFGLSAVFSFSTLHQVVNSPRVMGNVSLFDKLFSFGLQTETKVHYGTALMRLFSSDMLGTGSDFSGWGNYLEAPVFYSSILVLLLLPQVFIGATKKAKIVFGVTISIALLTVIFPFFRYAFWLFSGDYFRFYSFGIMLFFIIMALRAFQSILQSGKVNLIVLTATAMVLFIALHSGSAFNVRAVDKTIKIVLWLIILYGSFIAMLNFPRTRLAGLILIGTTLLFEVGIMSGKTVNNRIAVKSEEFSQKTGYNDYSVEALSFIKSKDKGFYRITKNYMTDVAIHMAINDAKIQNYYGGTNYYSFNQLQYIRFFQETGAIQSGNETDTRWCLGYLNRPLLQLICNVKYVLTKAQVDPLLRFMNDSLTTFGDVSVRKSKFSMPLGVTYSSYMNHDDFKKLSPTGKDIALMKCVIQDSVEKFNTGGLTEIKGNQLPQSYDFNQLQADIANHKSDTLKIIRFAESNIKGNITLKSKKVLFLAIPNDEGWQAKIDGKWQRPITVSAGMMGLVLDAGRHSIELDYVRPMVKTGIYVSIASLFIFMVLGVLSAIYRKKGNDKPISDK